MDDQIPPHGTPPYASPPPPPPIIAPVLERPRKGGRGLKILCLLLFIALGFSVMSNMRHIGAISGGVVQQGEEPLEEFILENNHSNNKIAVLDVEGVIASTPMDRRGGSIVDAIRQQLKTAGRDKNVVAVVLKVNSPGGEVLASDEIYNSIRDFQTKYKKPVVASMGSLAASGGYYVSAPCQWIVANEMTITGSIGVIMHGYNYRGLMDKIGLRPDVYKSGIHKDMLSPDRLESEIPADEREMIQGLIMETYGKFTNIVAAGRQESNRLNKGKGRMLASDWTEYADGRVLSGKQALNLGLIDDLGDFNKAVEQAKSIAKVGTANLIHYEEPFDLGNLFRIFGKTEAPASTIKVDLGLDFPKLQIGRLYFIAPITLP
jgi:protease-4